MPAEAIVGMRNEPSWPLFEAIAPTLGYDNAVLGDGTVPHEHSTHRGQLPVRFSVEGSLPTRDPEPAATKERAPMTRRALVLGAMAAALFLPTPAAAAPPEGSLRLTSVEVGGTEIPHGFTFNELVYQRGKLVGTDRAVCKFRGRFENLRCRITLALPNGELFLFARFQPGDRGNFVVTRGTGKYQGKAGVGIFRNVGDATRITIWLTT